MRYVVEVKDLVTKFGQKVIHDHLTFNIESNNIFAILGSSGAGKTVLLSEILMLLRPYSGIIKVLGRDLNRLTPKDEIFLRKNWGVLFQFGALYSSLNVYENVAVTLNEYTNLSKSIIDEIVFTKLNLVGLKSEVAMQYPSELSGGMIKRVALARALAMDPKILFLDEPTSGLDPVGARAFDSLIKNLQKSLDLSVIMITHDLDSIFSIVDKMIVLSDKKIVAQGSLQEVLKSTHPFVEQFFKNEYVKSRFWGGENKCIVE